MSIRSIHQCECEDCQVGDGDVSRYHHPLNVLMSRLDERQRRWLAALEANRLGLTGDNVPKELAASGIEHRNHAENSAVYGV